MDTTFVPKLQDIENDRKWYVVDAEGMVLGRLATQVATILRGKNKPIFTPHMDTGDYVIIINCEKIVLTGNKLDDKFYFYHTGYPGGDRHIPYRQLLQKKPEFAVYEAIRGMLPKNTLGRQMIKKLKVYRGAEHMHQAQQPQELKLV